LRDSKPQLPQGKGRAVDSVSKVTSADKIPSVSALDTRKILLEELAKDAAVSRRVTEILESAEGQLRVPVAMFSSAI
jgi:hypothetical protein